jgi:hypothetical protein
VQAQNDLMELLARKEISIVSTEDEIKIIAKKKLTVNGGGVISLWMPMLLNQRRWEISGQEQGITPDRKSAA